MPDLVQEVYLRVLRASHPEAIRNPEAYLITVASHVAFEFSRFQKTNAPFLADIADIDVTSEMWQLVAPIGDDPAARAENVERVEWFQRKILARLPPRVGVALVLHRIHGYSVQETADQMGITRETVKKYLADAVERCREFQYGGTQEE